MAGAHYLSSEDIPVVANVADQEDALSAIVCLIYVDGTLYDSLSPDSSGELSFTLQGLEPGSGELMVRAVDSDGAVGEDSIDLSVFDDEEPLLYTISGGPTLFDYWSVDDDVEVRVDGQVVFLDDNNTQDNHPPLTFEAQLGSSIQITAVDENACDQEIDPMFLHFGSNHMQQLISGQCLSSCEDSACYEPSFNGPWPNTFVDSTVTIEIP